MGNILSVSEVIVILTNDSNISLDICFIFRWGHAGLFFEAGGEVALIAKAGLFRNLRYCIVPGLKIPGFCCYKTWKSAPEIILFERIISLMAPWCPTRERYKYRLLDGVQLTAWAKKDYEGK